MDGCAEDDELMPALSTMPNAALPAAMRKKAMDAIGGADMSPEDWRGLVGGLMQFLAEEAEEPEHAEDDTGAVERQNEGLPPKGGAMDKLTLAMDKSLRSFDDYGHLRVKVSNISKAQIRPYAGKEIPGWDEENNVHLLGLDPDKTYIMLCPPDELAKSAKAWNGKPLLLIHKPSDAEDHPIEETIGSVYDVDFADPYLRAALSVWRQEGIDLIETEEAREISCGYGYDPEMTPGVFNGEKYDGVMHNLKPNHVAIVEEGRAGPDVMVADSIAEMQWDIIEDAIRSACSA
jgi:hypothetical protein